MRSTQHTSATGIAIDRDASGAWRHCLSRPADRRRDGTPVFVGPAYRTLDEAYADHADYLRRAGWADTPAPSSTPASRSPLLLPLAEHIAATLDGFGVSCGTLTTADAQVLAAEIVEQEQDVDTRADILAALNAYAEACTLRGPGDGKRVLARYALLTLLGIRE